MLNIVTQLFYNAVLRLFLLCVLVYIGFMYRGLAVLSLYATLIVFVFALYFTLQLCIQKLIFSESTDS